MSAAYQDLCTIIKKKNTQSVLWVVNDVESIPSNALVEIHTPQTLTARKQYQYHVGIAYSLYDSLSTKELDRLYACMRDQWCRTSYLYEQYARRELLVELGFQLLKKYADQTALFYFDLDDYKRVPEWLNSRFWANPKRWGKSF